VITHTHMCKDMKNEGRLTSMNITPIYGLVMSVVTKTIPIDMKISPVSNAAMH